MGYTPGEGSDAGAFVRSRFGGWVPRNHPDAMPDDKVAGPMSDDPNAGTGPINFGNPAAAMPQPRPGGAAAMPFDASAPPLPQPAADPSGYGDPDALSHYAAPRGAGAGEQLPPPGEPSASDQPPATAPPPMTGSEGEMQSPGDPSGRIELDPSGIQPDPNQQLSLERQRQRQRQYGGYNQMGRGRGALGALGGANPPVANWMRQRNGNTLGALAPRRTMPQPDMKTPNGTLPEQEQVY